MVTAVDPEYVADPDKIIKRQMVWDLLPCAEASSFIPKMGLLPASDSGDLVEHAFSHARMNLLAPIIIAVNELSDLAGEVAGRAILDVQGHEIEDESDPHLEQYKMVVAGCTQTVIAHLLDSGVLHISGAMYE